jgi:ferredoxin-NADP reductase
MTEASAETTMPIPWQIATVRDVVTRTPRIKSFMLVPAMPFRFQAGQHVDVRLTAPDGYRAMRSYSIASAPEETTSFELAVERLDDGEVSPFFHDVVVSGDEIELRGPLGGYFLWPAHDTGAVLLIGGGSGVVPLVSMIRHRRASDDPRPVTLLYSARTWDDVIYREELLELDGRSDGFRLKMTLTREGAHRPGDYSRRVDAAMIAETLAAFASPPSNIFVCGTNAFVNAAADGALAAGIPAASILTERYGG